MAVHQPPPLGSSVPGSMGTLIPIRSSEEFRRLVMSLVDAATRVWPDIAMEFRDIRSETEH